MAAKATTKTTTTRSGIGKAIAKTYGVPAKKAASKKPVAKKAASKKPAAKKVAAKKSSVPKRAA